MSAVKPQVCRLLEHACSRAISSINDLMRCRKLGSGIDRYAANKSRPSSNKKVSTDSRSSLHEREARRSVISKKSPILRSLMHTGHANTQCLVGAGNCEGERRSVICWSIDATQLCDNEASPVPSNGLIGCRSCSHSQGSEFHADRDATFVQVRIRACFAFLHIHYALSVRELERWRIASPIR